jgi:hypothetical protein
MRGRGQELAVGAMVRLVVSGDEVSSCQEVIAGEVVVRRNVGACGRGVTDLVGEPFRRVCCVEGCVASCRGVRSPTSFRSHPA